MSGETGSEARSRSHARWFTLVATVGFVLCCAVVAVALSGSVAAQEEAEDSEPPEFGNATKGNLTAIELTITDDVDVDESSITASDFALEPGRVDRVSVNESGNDSVVTIQLADVVASDEVTVSIADGGSIADAAGNELTAGNATVSGMDGYRPQLQDFGIERVNESAAIVRVVSSERLSELYVGVGGSGTDTLTMADFTRIGNGTDFRVPYEANVTFPQEGTYELLVGTMTDRNNVTTRYRVERTVLVDHTPPTPEISAPASAGVGESVTFDAGGSTDEYGVDGYEWRVDGNATVAGDGNATATGETMTHTFRTPGYHGVTLTVRDRRNNTANVTYPIFVESATTTENVTVGTTTVDNETVVTATVGTNRTTGRVLIERDGGLVSTPSVTVDSLAVDVPVDERADLTFSAASNASAWFRETNATALAGFAVDHERSLSTATFRFTVNRSRLAAAGLSPGDVTLYREVNGWRSIYTTRIGTTDRNVTYEATAAGLSRFVVGGSGGATADGGSGDGAANDSTGDTDATDDTDATNDAADDADDADTDESDTDGGSARILVANSSLLTDAADAGDRIVVRATVANSGTATGDYVVGLVVDNSVVATTPVTVPAGANRTVTFAERVDGGGTVVVNGTVAGTLTVGGGANETATSGGGIPIPNPLALWPGGLFGQVLGAVFWFLVISYAVLKGLAIYLGY